MNFRGMKSERCLRSFGTLFVLVSLCLVALVGVPQSARAAATTYTVTTLDEPATGNDATCAAICTLRQAVNASNANNPGTGSNTIRFAAGLTGTITLASGTGFGTLTLVYPVSITGPGAALLTVSGGCTDCGTDGANTSNTGVRIFLVNYGGNTTLSGITVANGGSGDGGSGVFNNGGTLTVTDCAFANNSAQLYGGSIYTTGHTASLVVTRSTFTGNSTGYLGGAIYSIYSTLTVISSTFVNNHARNEGGAIFNHSGSTGTITASTFVRNNASFGGAITNYSDNSSVPARLTVVNSTLSENSVTDGGGTLFTYLNGATTTVVGSTISGNTANVNGGIGGVSVSRATLTLTDTIVAGNTTVTAGISPDLYEYNDGSTSGVFSGSNNLIGVGDTTNYTGLTNGVNGNQFGTTAAPLNPRLAPLALNAPGNTQTHALLPGSPAIDAGTCTYSDVGGIAGSLATDQRGIPRPQGTACDIGAFESQGFAFSNPMGGGQSTAISTTFARPLALSVVNSHGEPVNSGTATFTITSGSGGASATFNAASGTGCTVSTDRFTAVCPVTNGSATTPLLAANTQGGTFTVVASTAGIAVSGNVTYMLSTGIVVPQPTRRPDGMTMSGATPAPQPIGTASGSVTVTAVPLPQPVRH